MDYSVDKRDEGMGDWPPRMNKVVEEESASDSSSDDDEGELREYPMGLVHRGSISAVMGPGEAGGPLNLR
jgi:hypothetical protein